jgi:hypothetical protein
MACIVASRKEKKEQNIPKPEYISLLWTTEGCPWFPMRESILASADMSHTHHAVPQTGQASLQTG